MIKKTGALLSISVFSILVYADNVPNDISLMAKGIIKNAKEIERIDRQVKMIAKERRGAECTKTQSEKNDIVEKSKNAKVVVVNVKNYAHFREKPGQNIQIYLPLGTNLYIERCNEVKECEDCKDKVKKITWCYSPDFGGGYIAKNLLQFKNGASQ